ncbi:hypothetical protein LSM04_002516 [Trypanosoma melophagium]|uniref:uncharacterized protein n=1 Tax=Trypanosoma melophagium TaxID=715481 RepID=UPI00351AAAF9|nr:hypothetical protein LSM04_002516 [Trypanosoma melophagium]
MGVSQSVEKSSQHREGCLRRPPHRIPPATSLPHTGCNIRHPGQVDSMMDASVGNSAVAEEQQLTHAYPNAYLGGGGSMKKYEVASPVKEGSFSNDMGSFGMSGHGFSAYENDFRDEEEFLTSYGNVYDMGDHILNRYGSVQQQQQHSNNNSYNSDNNNNNNNMYTGGVFERQRSSEASQYRHTGRMQRSVSFLSELETTRAGRMFPENDKLPGILLKKNDNSDSSSRRSWKKEKKKDGLTTETVSFPNLLLPSRKLQLQDDDEKKEEGSSSSSASLAPPLLPSKKLEIQRKEAKREEDFSSDSAFLAPSFVPSKKSQKLQNHEEERPPTPVKRLSTTLTTSGNRVRTLVAIDLSVAQNSPDNSPRIAEEGFNSIGVVKVGDPQLNADEVTWFREDDDIVKSEELKRAKEKFLSGYSVSMICTEGSGVAERAPPLESTSWCMLKKLIHEILDELAEEGKEESKEIQLACAFVAVKGNMVADLLKNKATFERLSVRPSPLFGMRLVGVEYRNIIDSNTFDSMITHVAGVLQENKKVEDSFIVLSFMLNKRTMGTKEEEGDVVVTSLLVIMAGDAVEKLLSVLEGSSTEAKAILDDCVNGAYHTLSIYVSHQQDEWAEKGFKLLRQLMVAKHEPLRFGSAQTLRKRLGDAVETAQIRLSNMTNPVEKKNTEKFIENRIALMESLNELLEVVRPRS